MISSYSANFMFNPNAMRKTIISLLLLAILISCKEVTFKTPQPAGKKALSKIPRSLQGRYLTLEDDGTPTKDTIIVTASGYSFGYFDPTERFSSDGYDAGTLSDSLVLKSYKGYYFLSVNQNPEWILRVLKPQRNGDLMFMILEDKKADFNDFLERLSLEIKIDSTTTPKETLYQITPSSNELMQLIKKGYFSSTRLVKIR